MKKDTEKIRYFRLSNLLDPFYLADRARSIESFGDILSRCRDLLVLIFKIMTFRYGERHRERDRQKKLSCYIDNINSITDLSTHLKMSESYLGRKDYKNAMMSFNRVLEIEPNNKTAHFKVGELSYLMEEFDEAIVKLKKALELDNENAYAHVLLGSSLRYKRRYEEAEEELEKALKLSQIDKGSMPDIYNEMAQIYLKQGKYALAKEAADKVKDLDFSSKHAYRIVGTVFWRERQYASALSEFDKALKLSGGDKEFESNIYNEMAQIYFEQGKREQGMIEVNKSMELNSQNSKTHFCIGKGYRYQKRYEDSFNEFVIAKRMNEDNEEFEKSINCEMIKLVEDININNNEKAVEIAGKTLQLNFTDNARDLNILTNELEIAQRATKLNSKVRKLRVNLTNQCNLDCKMCCVPQTPKQEISKKVKDEILKLFPFVEKIKWLGGEAFLYPGFGELLDEALRYPIEQQIVTNGLLINEEIGAKLVKNNVRLEISIDGVTKEVYEDIRRGGNYELLIQKLEMINTLRNKINPKYSINMNIVITRSNYRQIEAFAEFARKYNFDLISLILMSENRNNENIFNIYRDEKVLAYVSKAIDKARENCEKYGISFNSNITKDLLQPNLSENHKNVNNKHCASRKNIIPNNRKICQAPWKVLNISMLGEVCPNVTCFCRNVVGNLNTQSMDEIWNGEKMVQYRQQIVSGQMDKVCALKNIYKDIPFGVLV